MSSISPDELERIIGEPEDENLEFKKAQNKFGVDELTKYCVALANERGGTGTDDHTVVLRLSGRMLDPGFVQFLGRYVPERLDELAIDDWLALSRVASERPLPEGLKVRLKNLSDRGLIERVGGGKFILPRVYYEFHRRQDTYDRLRRTEQIKEDIERHLESFRIDGIAMGQLEECMAPLTRQELRPLLVELQQEGRVRSLGERRWTRYFLV